jgi:FtsP/CotA-like multicopper oxidase with cupredoxin domain
MRNQPWITVFAGAALMVGCAGTSPDNMSATSTAASAATALTTRNMEGVKGQQATCNGPNAKTFNLDVVETTVDLGMSTTFAAWTYNGRIPGPTIEACEGDQITINVTNKGTTSHGLDTHAFKIDARKYGPVIPGKTLTMVKTVDTPGVFMYHCAAGPVTDVHIKSGIHGAMVVYPRGEQLRPAREIVVVEDAVFGTRDEKGFIPGTDPAKTLKNDQTFSMFNGRLDNDAVRVNTGDLVRMYFVNVGPGCPQPTSSAAFWIACTRERPSFRVCKLMRCLPAAEPFSSSLYLSPAYIRLSITTSSAFYRQGWRSRSRPIRFRRQLIRFETKREPS